MEKRDRAQKGAGDTERVGAAFDAGAYRNFTGWIVWGKTNGYAEHADFTLSNDPIGLQLLVPDKFAVNNVWWKGGTWVGGIWEYGEWEHGRWLSGTWDGGYWHGGSFDSGTWRHGTWEDGDWNTANAEWLDGEWFTGRCLDINTGAWVRTNEDPCRFNLRRNKER